MAISGILEPSTAAPPTFPNGPAVHILLWQLLQLRAQLMDERTLWESLQVEYNENVMRLENEKTVLLLAVQDLNSTLQDVRCRLRVAENQLTLKTEMNVKLKEDLEGSKKQLKEETRIKTYKTEELQQTVNKYITDVIKEKENVTKLQQELNSERNYSLWLIKELGEKTKEIIDLENKLAKENEISTTEEEQRLNVCESLRRFAKGATRGKIRRILY
jgi:chromosome segregation ATPase